MVRLLSHHPKVEGSSAPTVAGIGSNKKCFLAFNYLIVRIAFMLKKVTHVTKKNVLFQ